MPATSQWSVGGPVPGAPPTPDAVRSGPASVRRLIHVELLVGGACGGQNNVAIGITPECKDDGI